MLEIGGGGGVLDVALSVLGSVFSGGVTGLLGVGVQRLFDWLHAKEQLKQQEARQAHEVAMLRANAEVMAQEWAARTRVAEVEAAGKEAVGAEASFAASFQLEPKRFAEGMKPPTGGGFAKFFRSLGWLLMILIDFIRGLVRPGLTVYLCAITTLVWYEARNLLIAFDRKITADQAMQINMLVITTVLYLTTTCVLWWFGTRNKQSAPKVSP